MSEDELRQALTTLAEPGTPPGGATPRLVAAVERRRRRTTVALAAASVVVVVGIGATLAALPPGGGDRVDEPAADVGRWTTIATSPLAPRTYETSVWTGEEMLVFGGNDAAPCPPNADCGGGLATRQFRDGAAYDPDTDSWRRIADTPIEFGVAQALLVGGEVVVVAQPAGRYEESQTWTYDISRDAWRRGADAPAYGSLQGLAGDRVVMLGGGEPAGWLYDPLADRWTALPADPLGDTFDRSLVFDGTDLLLLALPTEGGDDRTYLFARLDLDTMRWATLPRTPVGMGVSVWFWWKDQLLNPSDDIGGGVWDPATDEWRDVPQVGDEEAARRACPLPIVPPAGGWVGYHETFVSIDPDRAIPAPPCPAYAEVHTAVWTGADVITWGATDQGYHAHVGVGLRWSPPAP